jgi:hypothetical protein
MYALKGLEIFPVGSDKRPLSSQHNATTDLDQIEQWWERWPDALIGHRINPHVVLLDIDPRHNGKQTWDAIRAELNSHLPTTRVHISGREDGGGHVWFERPDGKLTTTKLDEWAEAHGVGASVGGRWTAGIDLLRHEHRYTILPPSPHADTGRPYRWSERRGLNVLPARMPAWLATLLTRDEAPTPPEPQTETFKQADSIADWFSDNHRWRDVLEPNGWTCVSGDGDQDGSEWRHPAATSSVSATVRHQCLFVYSTNTPFEPTEPDSPKGYTRFAAWAVLSFAGDQKRAAGEARTRQRAMSGPNVVVGRNENGSSPTDTHPPASDQPGATGSLPAVATQLPSDFWTSRSELAHIRQAAHARQRSADAVLHVILARVASIVPHKLVLPAVVGTVKPLCYFAAIVAPPGVGKSDANGIGVELIPAPEYVSDQIPPGSGEGLAELLFDLIEEPKEGGKGTIKVKRQVRHNAYVYADEGQVISDLGSRAGSVLLPAMRTIWSGGPLGQANANVERRRIVPAMSYSFGIVAGFQVTRVGPLLDDADAGTPQRFGWAYAIDPTIPDDPPEWPGELPWTPTHQITGGDALEIDQDIAREIRAADLARARGRATTHLLDAQGGLFRLKVAAGLALLAGRRKVTKDDWLLSGMVKTSSDAIRERISYELEQLKYKGNVSRGLAEAQRRIVVADVVDDDSIQKTCARVETLLTRQSRWSHSLMRKAAGQRWREHFEEAVDRLAAVGKVIIIDEGDKKFYERPR